MKAAVYYETGGPEVFRYEDVPDPDRAARARSCPGRGGQHRGWRHPQPAGRRAGPCPTSSATSAPATVLDVGDGVDELAAGDRVVTVGLDGSHAELRAVAERSAGRSPTASTTEEAACVPVPFGRPTTACSSSAGSRPGETALIHAGASGVGHRRHPAGQPGRGPGAGHRVEPRAAGAAGRARPRPRASTTRPPTSPRRSGGSPTGRGPTSSWTRWVAPTCSGASHCLAYRGRCVTFGDAGGSRRRRSTSRPCGPNNQTLVGLLPRRRAVPGAPGPTP